MIDLVAQFKVIEMVLTVNNDSFLGSFISFPLDFVKDMILITKLCKYTDFRKKIVFSIKCSDIRLKILQHIREQSKMIDSSICGGLKPSSGNKRYRY